MINLAYRIHEEPAYNQENRKSLVPMYDLTSKKDFIRNGNRVARS